MKKKGKWISFFVILVFLLTALPIMIRTIIDIIEVYKLDINKVNQAYFSKIIFDKHTYLGMFKLDNPFRGIGILIIAWYVISFLINIFGLFKPDEKFKQSEEYGSHGTSRWQTKIEIKHHYYKDKLGWFMGSIEKDKYYKIGIEAAHTSVRSKKNMQMLVVGPPGTNKTTGFVLPNIFHLPYIYTEMNKWIDKKLEKRENFISTHKNKVLIWGYDKINKTNKLVKEMPDFIITDPKTENFGISANYLIETGYDVKVLDYIDLAYGDKFNPLDFINDDKELMEIAQGYVESVEMATSKNGGGGDQAFWNEQEAQVLAALIGFVKQKYPKERQNLTEVSKLLTSPEIRDLESAEYFFKDNDIKGAANQLWNNFLAIAESERTRANILGGLATKLKLFAIEGVQNVTSSTTLDITQIGAKKEKPIALFIFMPVQDKTYAPIINVTINTIHKQLYKTAKKTRNKLANPVYEIIEEMANIGKIPNIQELLGTMRGLRVYPMMIWQSLAQMRDRYKDGWEDILSMCDWKVFLGVNDHFTAEQCSKALGETTIKIQGVSSNAQDGLFTPEKRTESSSYTQRRLKLPSECMDLHDDELIVKVRGDHPFELYKVQYKYWESDKELCPYKDVDTLPALNNYSMESGAEIPENSDNDTHIKEIEFNKESELQFESVNTITHNNLEKQTYVENFIKYEREDIENFNELENKEAEQAESIDFNNIEINEEMLKNITEQQEKDFDLEI